MKNALLTIGGFDPTAGAGVCLDLRVFYSMDFIGMAVLTAVTSQNTQQVVRVHSLSPEQVQDQFTALARDVAFSGIKVSMLGCRENVAPVRSVFVENDRVPVVIDPIYKASSGAVLSPKQALIELLKMSKKWISLVTPNRDEASALLNRPLGTLQEATHAARQLSHRFETRFLITGIPDKDQLVDVLYSGERIHLFRNKKVKAQVHGTGCFLSSSLLGCLVQGESIESSCQKAGELTHKAILKAVQCGRGQRIILRP